MKTEIIISRVESRDVERHRLQARSSELSSIRPSILDTRQSRAFTLIEILVVVVLMSLIVLALMAVFNSTQAAFRASLTQTDVLEGGRAAMGLIKSDLESMTPSFGVRAIPGRYSTVRLIFTPVPIYASINPTPTAGAIAGRQRFIMRTNVLEEFFILTRQNTTWTGVGYVVDTTCDKFLNPLYRFSMSTNVMAPTSDGALQQFSHQSAATRSRFRRPIPT